ncbi:UNVERIFIED_CONTAM: hypothetical protein K2H54_026421 [Gekko kuhli]
MKSRQQVLSEVNKRRTLLQDNSWIKKQPEEETEANLQVEDHSMGSPLMSLPAHAAALPVAGVVAQAAPLGLEAVV